MTYHQEHNLMPAPARIHNAQLDTMCLKRGLSMATISKNLDWDIQEIKDLNPIYKAEYIPASIKQRCVTGPLDKILLLVSMEDSLFQLENPITPKNLPNIDTLNKDGLLFYGDSLSGTEIFHKVKPNETVSTIAAKYKISVDELLEWNALNTSNVYVGQRIVLKKTNTQPPVVSPQKPIVKPVIKPIVKPKKYHTVRSGESLGKIAEKYGLSLSQIKKLNPGKGNIIQVGDKIRIK
jgi:membrane-bound lytic murein transglycosylase D